MEKSVVKTLWVLVLLASFSAAYNSSLIDTSKPADASDYPKMIADGAGQSLIGHGWEYTGYLMLFMVLIGLYTLFVLFRRFLSK